MNITPLLGIGAGATVGFTLLVLLLKSVVLLALAGVLNRLLRHVGAAVHHALWTAALIAVLLLPAASAILPSWSLALPPLQSRAGTEIASSQATRPTAPRRLVSLPTPTAGIRHPNGKAIGAIASHRNLAGGEPAQSPSMAIPTPVLSMRNPPESIHWPAWLFLVWSAGAAILLFLRLFAGLAVGRIIHRARRITDGSLADALELARRKINLTRRAALYVSEETAMPVVRGIFRSCVVLPATAGTWPQGRIQSVLTHELGHVKRWDCLTLLIGQVAAGIYWLNPLVWLACRQLRTQCEQACDDLVLVHGTAAVTYAEDLLAVARTRRVHSLISAAAVPLARSSQLKRRMLAILDGTVARQGLSRRLLLAAGFATLALTLAFGMLRPVNKAQAATVSAAANAAKKSMTLTVSDQQTGKPLAGVKVGANSNGGYMAKLTDTRGRAVLPLPRHKWSRFYIQVHAKGYVPELLSWNMYGEKREAFPATYTLALPRGTVISGRVVDNHGQPIVGAHVLIYGCKMKQANIHEKIDVLATVQTGRNGVWRYCGIPAHGVSEIEIGTWDYRYVWSHWSMGFFPIHTFTDLTRLRNGKSVFILQRGIMAHGVVLGPDGKPVAGAQITVGPDQNPTNTPSPMKANAAGQFSFVAKPGHGVVLTAWAKGYGPALGIFHIRANSPSIFLRLTAPHTLTGRVVDPAGRPLADASVYTDTWRGYRTLIHHIRTNSRGWFIWRDAPAGKVLVDASAPGYAYAMDISVRAGKDNRIILLPRVTVHGTVVDAKTGQPIDKFRIIRGFISGLNPLNPPLPHIAWNRNIHWDYMYPRDVSGHGHFTYRLPTQRAAYAIRIEAKGFLPTESRIFHNNVRKIDLQFKLTPAKDITATVLNPDGAPAVGAKAILVPAGQSSQIGAHEDLASIAGYPHQTIDRRGRLDFAPHSGGYQIAVWDRAGYAIWPNDRPPTKNNLLQLQRWGSIHGRLLFGTKPAPGQKIEAWTQIPLAPRITQGISWNVTTRTNSAGEFLIKRCPAGKVQVGMQVRMFTNSTSSLGRLVVVQAGKTTRVVLGGMGRCVEGRVSIPPAFARSSDWKFEIGSAGTKRPSFLSLMPKNIRRGYEAAKTKWLRSFLASPAGKAWMAGDRKWMRTKMHDYSFTVQPDGRFTIPDVLPGTYVIGINAVNPAAITYHTFRQKTATGYRTYQEQTEETVGVAKGTFTVGPIPGGVTNVSLKLPPLKLEMIKPAKSNNNPP